MDLAGDLALPPGARGIVVFVHGSGSSRHSPRNQFVAHELHQAGLATLLFDLLTPAEEEHDRFTGELRFNIGFLADRLGDVTEQVRRHPETRHLPIGYFGASTGAAATLVAGAERPAEVAAIVSRGGRPDLAGGALEKVVAPTLLIVGGEDHRVLDLNEQAFLRLRCTKRLEIVPGRHICSRSRGRSVQWRAWRPRGSGTSSPGRSRLTSIPARRLRILRRRKCHDA
ncbi:hypothetical protein Anae109_3309 [Anaeromyxobacter sp. Fw109-5]|nr:hypothetical protein Anae109_3309 [Anaeromyxobacter sp. Fw109-5]